MPIGPEFHDPDTGPNFPPQITITDPPAETTVSAPFPLRVTVLDRNSNDKLFVRWVSDYPPYAPSVTRLVSEKMDQPLDPMTSTATFKQDIDCANSFVMSAGPHKVVVIISDRAFLPADPNTQPTTPYNVVEDGSVPVMTRWDITGCL